MTNAAIFVVATPIGNLEDIGTRAVRVLREAHLIAAEDTRRARQLLSHLGIQKKEIISYYDQVERSKAPRLCERIVQDDLTLALISDAGTPCVSDPGYHLIKEAHQRRIPVHPIPGPSAALALLSAAGLPCDRFSFVGFLPSRPKAVKAEITGWTPRMGTILFFESVRRLQRAVRLIAETYPAAEIAIGRELTKLHEDIYSGPIANARWFLEQETVLKGEAVVAVSLPADADGDESSNAQREELMTLLRRDLADGATFKDLLQRYKDRNISRSDLYQMMVRIKEGGDDE